MITSHYKGKAKSTLSGLQNLMLRAGQQEFQKKTGFYDIESAFFHQMPNLDTYLSTNKDVPIQLGQEQIAKVKRNLLKLHLKQDKTQQYLYLFQRHDPLPQKDDTHPYHTTISDFNDQFDSILTRVLREYDTFRAHGHKTSFTIPTNLGVLGYMMDN